MKRIQMTMALLAAVGCGGGNGTGEGGASPQGVRCESSTQCALGQVCEDNQCLDFAGCLPGDCPEGTYCDETYACVSVAEKCGALVGGCECHIADGGGRFVSEGIPEIRLASGSSRRLDIVLAGAPNGAPVPGALFTFTLDSDRSFEVADADRAIVATDTPGTAVLTAHVGDNTACMATLVNLGPGPTDGQVRFHVFDDATGEAIVGAIVVVDADGDGIDDGGASETDAEGLTGTTMLPSGAVFAATVFRDGYNYLSIVGLSAAETNDVALPLMHGVDVPQIGGFSGTIDFSAYESSLLASRGKAIKAGFASSSIPLKEILNLNLDLLLGPITGVDCQKNPRPAGCYDIQIGDFLQTRAPLPGGVVIAFQGNDIKSHFDVIGSPGRRYAWGIGTEIDLGELSGLFDIARPFISACTCDVQDGVCDGDAADPCACDLDCGLQLDFGRIQDSLMPMLPGVAVGFQGNLPLQSTTLDSWNGHIEVPYSDRSVDARFPRLDNGRGGDYGQLATIYPLRSFTALKAQKLPPDPAMSEQFMDTMVVVSGVNASGFGFVPLGLGVGLDCRNGDCLDKQGNREGFDRIVNGARMCIFDADPAFNGCPPEMPETVDDGTVGLFRAEAPGALRDGTWLTLAVAFPLTGFVDGAGVRASAYVLRGEPVRGAETLLLDGDFPAAPVLPEAIEGRSYRIAAGTHDGHWVTFASHDMAHGATRWNVFFARDATAFHAPEVPRGWGDPLAGSDETNPQGMIDVTHVGVQLVDGYSVESLAANGGATLSDIPDALAGFSIRATNLPSR